MKVLSTNNLSKFFIAAVIISCFFITGCENSQQELDVWTKSKPLQEEAIDIESFLSQDGRVKARLKSPLMLRIMRDTQYLEFPNTLHVDFYDSTKKVETWLDSKYGKYFEGLDKVYLRDSVVVITLKGDTLKAPDLWWDQRQGIFYTDKYAEYHSKDQNITGNTGMTATQDLKSVTFQNPTGTVDVSAAGIAP